MRRVLPWLVVAGLAAAEDVTDWVTFAAEHGFAATADAVAALVTAQGAERARMRLAARGFGYLEFPLVIDADVETLPDPTNLTGCSWDGSIQCGFTIASVGRARASGLVAVCEAAEGTAVGGTQLKIDKQAAPRGAERDTFRVRGLTECWRGGGARVRIEAAPEPAEPPLPPRPLPLPTHETSWAALERAMVASRHAVPSERVPRDPLTARLGLHDEGTLTFGAFTATGSLDPKALAEALDAMGPQLEACYLRRVEEGMAPGAHLSLELEVSPEGAFGAVSVRFEPRRAGGERLVADRELRTCLTEVLRSGRVAPGRHAFARVVQRVVFEGP